MKKILIIIAVVLLLAGGGYYYWHQHQSKHTVVQVPITVVQTTPVKAMPITQSVSAVGNLLAPESVELKSQVSGVVEAILFRNGSRTKQGSLLFRINDIKAHAAVVAAQAEFEQAKVSYERYLKAYKKGAYAKQEVDSAHSTLQQTRSKLSTAHENMIETDIKAPFGGTLGATEVTLGSFVQPGDSLVQLVNRRDLQVEYHIPERYLGKIWLGQKVQLTTHAYKGVVFHGVVDYISPVVQQNSRTLVLRAHVPNPKEKLAPGMFVNVTQILSVDKKALVVPSISLVPTMAGYSVYVVRKGKVLKVPVKIGHQQSGFTQIKHGLKLGQEVISAGQAKVKEGQKVKVLK